VLLQGIKVRSDVEVAVIWKPGLPARAKEESGNTLHLVVPQMEVPPNTG
jgi:hypothetical protein